MWGAALDERFTEASVWAWLHYIYAPDLVFPLNTLHSIKSGLLRALYSISCFPFLEGHIKMEMF